MDADADSRRLRGSRYELRTRDVNAVPDHHALDVVAAGRWGFLHSEETGSAVDGPGIRVVFWTTGCEFRCVYCHNPDTWKLKNGRLVCVADLLQEVAKYREFLRCAGGGVTVSGGEPLLQRGFVLNLLRGVQELGVHTALDTNGFLGAQLTDTDLECIDLVLLDLKSWDPATHLRVTGHEVAPVLAFARRLAELRKPVWLRFVLVPGVTDVSENVAGIAGFAAGLGNVHRVDVLPFHQLGRYKWRELGMPYDLDATVPPSPEALELARAEFRRHGLECPG